MHEFCMGGAKLAHLNGDPLGLLAGGRGHGQLARRPCPRSGCWGPIGGEAGCGGEGDDGGPDQAGWSPQCMS